MHSSDLDPEQSRWPKIDARLAAIIAPAYLPCAGFTEPCRQMRYLPGAGHVPRGYLGATGSLDEVELVLVFAEPGDPQPDEQHTGFASAYAYATEGFAKGIDQFHRNVRWILAQCWPHLSFRDQLRRVWLTESVLCSAPIESGSVPVVCERECAKRYLVPQLDLFHGRVIAALGSKAARRMQRAGVSGFIAASAAAPPGANKPGARESWTRIADAVKGRGT